MGNSPSTSKAASQSSSPQAPSQHDRPVRPDYHNPFPVQNPRVAAPPEPSLTQAQGTSVQPLSSTGSRPKPLQPRPLGPGASSGFSTASSSTTAASSTNSAKPVEVKQRDSGPSHVPAKPVAVPNSHNLPASPRSPRSPRSDDIYESAPMPHSSLQDVSYLTRPPRLPLPIEEELHTPGSPIIAPTDDSQPIDDLQGLDSANLTHPISNLSDTSGLEEEDAEELLVDKTRPTVPTSLEWRHGGEKIYVTGTIFQWNRKTRLHPVEGQPGVFRATVNVLPGTHHIRFLVDGQMQTSPDYPTTVDFGNNLVNYIEVNPDDLPPAPAQTDGPSEVKSSQQLPQESQPPAEEEGKAPAPRDRDVPPPSQFQNKIPKYLLDLDQPEDSPLYHNAYLATEKLPNPPALPGFLSKPILNAATPRKDDNSVLTQPNHTVLNHLATSSIKNNVLAVSATTRYKSKYVTTIMYKPTTTEGI
ncbi:carbohydrate-binding module family 48 protein [Thermothielavioides terrestris NRRL 8126]|uniref:Carbohydrate-binding module family 48 protein n=1 Tax=Thermothielavioides terrestris (strain ATCC 38088 / NRRL 8126) TaxID=578455 RepID=G2QQQ4_THETT|nr:carbohydrate-binding module family 48 protein [Thermothielavioides terrestris NRRL 8126]AEO63264.1 carbohydrate-binding module family 48 protein [Thermothielavioides terrestris NRRL 8126]